MKLILGHLIMALCLFGPAAWAGDSQEYTLIKAFLQGHYASESDARAILDSITARFAATATTDSVDIQISQNNLIKQISTLSTELDKGMGQEIVADANMRGNLGLLLTALSKRVNDNAYARVWSGVNSWKSLGLMGALTASAIFAIMEIPKFGLPHQLWIQWASVIVPVIATFKILKKYPKELKISLTKEEVKTIEQLEGLQKSYCEVTLEAIYNSCRSVAAS